MTINSTTRKAGPFVGNGTVSAFPFGFKVFQASDLFVVRLNVSAAVEQTLVLNSDYSVTLNPDQNSNPGGVVTLSSALASGYTLTLTSDVPDTQPTDLTNQGGFYPEVINDALDRATIQIQQLQEETDRTITAPISTPAGTDLTFPLPDANKFIGWNSTATGLQNLDGSTLASIVAFATAYADTFNGDGVTSSFALSYPPATVRNLDVSINGVTQVPVIDYDINGQALNFTTPPPLGSVVLAKYWQALPNSSGAAQDFTLTPNGYTTAVDVQEGFDDLGSSAGTSKVGFLQAGTGAQARSAQDKLRDIISVKDFGAVGDGVADDWEACQKACDYVQSLGGGTVLFPAGETFRIAGNTIIIWGSNVNLIGYGATLYKDNAGGSAGYYGDALTVYGKINGQPYYSPQVAGGTYTSPATYAGLSEPSVNVSIEGFTVTFGTHSTDTINGISGINCEHVTVKNCVVESAPQTSFAWIATENSDCLHLTMDNCLSNGSGMQAFRFNSYDTSPGDAGEMFAKVINCRSENTQLTVVSPWPEQYGLPSSAFVRSSGNDIQFQVSFDNCQFDATTHLLDGYRTTSFRNCRLGFVFALNSSANCLLMFDNCRFRDFDVATGAGVIDSQIYTRNQFNGSAKIAVTACSFDAPSATEYNILNYGFDLSLDSCTGEINLYSVPEGVGYENVTVATNCALKNPGSSPVTVAAKASNFAACVFKSPLVVLGTNNKMVTVEDSQFVVDNTFSTFCIQVVTDASVRTVNNIVDYTNNSYATVRIADITYVVEKSNTYLYNGGAETSYDEVYAVATPLTGYWQATSRIINAQPTIGQPKAWVCSVAGAPGTWVSEGNL